MSADDDRLRDEAAAWVLGALDNTEAAEFVRRMEASAEVRREVAEMQEAADALPFSVVPVGPPPELRDRIMSVVESEAELLHATGARADRPYRPPTPWWRSLLRPLPVAAFACVLLLAGVVAGLVIGGGGSASERTVAAQVTGDGTANASARVEIEADHAQLVVDGMQSPGAGARVPGVVRARRADGPGPGRSAVRRRQRGPGRRGAPRRGRRREVRPGERGAGRRQPQADDAAGHRSEPELISS